METDERICKQIAFHFLSLLKSRDDLTNAEKEILEFVKPYANEFHRVGECGEL